MITTIVSNLRKAPLEVMAIETAAALTVSGASISANPSSSPKAYQSLFRTQPADAFQGFGLPDAIPDLTPGEGC